MTFLYLYVQRSNVFILFLFLRIIIFKVARIHELIYRTRSINEVCLKPSFNAKWKQQKKKMINDYLDSLWTEASQDIPDRFFLIVKRYLQSSSHNSMPCTKGGNHSFLKTWVTTWCSQSKMHRSDRDLSYKSAIIYFNVFISVGQYYLTCSGKSLRSSVYFLLVQSVPALSLVTYIT